MMSHVSKISWNSAARRTSYFSANSSDQYKSSPTTFISNALARLTTSFPIRPKPITPIVLPMISCPVIRFQCPARTALACSSIWRYTPSKRPNVCSATVVWFTPGQNVNGIPNSVQPSTSILSTPIPYLEIIFNRGRDRSRTSRVIASSPHKNASNSPASSNICDSDKGPRSRWTSTPTLSNNAWCGPGVSW